jgi:hypothetical protein
VVILLVDMMTKVAAVLGTVVLGPAVLCGVAWVDALCCVAVLWRATVKPAKPAILVVDKVGGVSFCGAASSHTLLWGCW